MHRRAKDHLKGAMKHERKRREEWTTIFERWNKDDLFRNNQSNLHGEIFWLFCLIWHIIHRDENPAESVGMQAEEFRNYPNHNGRPKNAGPNFTEAVEMAMTFSKEEWWVPDLRVEEKERRYDKLDPKTMEHLIWMSKNWASCFKEVENSSSAWVLVKTFFMVGSIIEWSTQWTEWQEQPWEKQEWHERKWNKMVVHSFRQRTATIWNSERLSFLDTVLLRVFQKKSRLDGEPLKTRRESEQRIPPDAHNTHIFLVFVSHCTHAHFAWLESCAQNSHVWSALSCHSLA